MAADRCRTRGHDLDPDGWRLCACARSIPDHADAAPDPAGGEGCGMTWRVCARCPHIDEHHITEHEQHEHERPVVGGVRVQPGGHLRQDVPAGLGLPHHQMSSEENLMVDPVTPVGGAA